MPGLLDEDTDPYANPDLLGIGPSPDALAQLYHAVTGYMTGSSKPTEPSWPLDNPVGTSSTRREPELRMPRGEFDPILPGTPIAPGAARPMTVGERQGQEDIWSDVFNNLSAIDTGGPTAPGPVALAARRVRSTPGPPRAPRTPAPEAPPPLETAPPPMGHNQPPAMLPPAGPAATVADLNVGERGMAAVPSLRSMTPPDASVAASSEPHIIPKPDGGFVGAPSWVRTPEHIQQMRSDLDAAIDRGAEGRDWYGRARGWNQEVTGSQFDAAGNLVFGDPTAARTLAEGEAVFSPQADPGTNLQFLLQASNAFRRGEPLALVRNTASATKYNTGMAAKEAAREAGQPEPDIPQGPKTGPYAWHLSPDRPYGTTGVNDIWHARSFGYTNADGSVFERSPTQQEHKFMDYETVLAIDRANARASGGFTDWDAAKVQASPWVANKEAKLLQDHPNWTPERAHEEALKTYPDFARGSTAYIPHEQVPGKSTGLLDLLPEDQRDAFSAASTWQNQQSGRDILTGNLFYQSPMLPAHGSYVNSAGQLEMNPAMVARPLVDFSANVSPREIHPGSADVLGGASYVRNLLDLQEGGGAHYIDTRLDRPLKERTSMRLDISGRNEPPSKDQIAALTQVAHEHGYYVSDTGDGISLIHAGRSAEDTPEGARPSPANGAELRDRLQGGFADQIQQAVPGVAIKTGRNQGPYADLSSELALSYAGQGRATEKVLAELESMRRSAPRAYDDMMNNPDIPAKMQGNLDRLTPAMRALRPDYVKLLETVRDGRLKALLEHVAKYGGAAGLPAALATFGTGSQQQPES